jgi:hypothetical protein
VCPHRRQIDKPVYRPQQMIYWHMTLNEEAIKQRLLFNLPLAHHHCNPPTASAVNQSHYTKASEEFFNRIEPKRTLAVESGTSESD